MNSDFRHILQVVPAGGSNDSPAPPQVMIKRELSDTTDLPDAVESERPNKRQRHDESSPIEVMGDEEFYERENVRDLTILEISIVHHADT